MGGNLFNSKRLSRQEYEEVASEVLPRLRSLLGLPMQAVKAYSNKESFGDLDIVVAGQPADYLKDILEAGQYSRNGNVVSFLYKGFQVDLIFVDPQSYNMAAFYFSYNDLNNLVGRVASALGFSLGYNGLFYKLENHEKVFLSNDPRLIYEFLGFDYARYLQGFAEPEELFEFVTSSKYFHPSQFDQSRFNNKDYTRFKKRPISQSFVDYASKLAKEENSPINHFNRAVEAFKEAQLQVRIEISRKVEAERVELKRLFNAAVVQKIAPLEGPQLGEFMSFVRSRWGPSLLPALRVGLPVIEKSYKAWLDRQL